MGHKYTIFMETGMTGDEKKVSKTKDLTPSFAFDVALNDRVKRVNTEGCCGVIKELRQEVTGSSGETANRAWLCKVQWDNGTFSYYSPSQLEKVKV